MTGNQINKVVLDEVITKTNERKLKRKKKYMSKSLILLKEKENNSSRVKIDP